MHIQPSPEMLQELPSPPYPLSVKHANLESLFNISYWLWRLNPLSVLPVMLSSAVDVLKQSVIVIALLFGLSQLSASGALSALAEAIRARNLSALFSTLSSIAPTIIFVIVMSASMFLIVSVIAGGFLNSAEYGSYLRLLHQGALSFGDVFKEMRVRWAKMAWTVLMVETLKFGPLLVALASIFYDILRLSFARPDSLQYPLLFADRLILWSGLILLSLVFTSILAFLTIYAYPAAADGSYGFAAVRRSTKVCTKLTVNTIVYCALRASSLVLVGLVSLATGLLGVQISSIATIIVGFLVTPVFHIFKTAVFLKAKPEPVVIPLPVGPPVFKDVFSHVLRTGFEKVKEGLHELAVFVVEPRSASFHLSSAIVFSVGAILGKQMSSSGIRQVIYALGYVPGRANPLSEVIYGLPFLALDISFHNWQVSLATTLSGIIFVAPVLVTLVFNGFVLGVVEDVVQNLTLFLAAILPHGVVELPAFIIAGSAGLSLGFEFLKALKRGISNSETELGRAFGRAVHIALGLVPLFIVAGIIETFVTPQIMYMYGWR
jgi:stage II sporulation protein M